MRVFHSKARYDMIVGQDILRAFGIQLDFKANNIICDGFSLPMREFPLELDTTPIEELLSDYVDCMLSNDKDLSSDNDICADKILDSSYEVFNPQ